MKRHGDIAVDTLERFEINGTTQWALIRGRKRDAPVLLLVQQGPGVPMIHEASALESDLRLEETFRVVYWDPRGTGKSTVRGAAAEASLEDLAADVRAMVASLCERCEVPRVHVVGFSFGGTLALLAARDAAQMASLVCVGPDVDFDEAERYAYAFACREAERRGHRRALRALRAIGEPPHMDPRRFMARVRWVSNFGGVHTEKTFGALLGGTLAALWSSPHYSLREMLGAIGNMSATQGRMLPKLAGLDLLARDLRIGVPLAIFQGRLDAVAPPLMTAALAERFGAPLISFERSAHMPHREEPARFRVKLLRFIDAANDWHLAAAQRAAVAAARRPTDRSASSHAFA
jgi:proline iminopeptidase